MQWPVVQKTIDTQKYFKYQFASHEIGKIKPDHEVYAHVIDSLGVHPANVVFLDDSAVNVKAAQEAGMKALHVQGAESARCALIENGLLLKNA